MQFDGVRPEPGGRAPAPGVLRLVQRFVNSVDLEDGPDDLADPDGLREWLTDAGLLTPAETGPAPITHARSLCARRSVTSRETTRTQQPPQRSTKRPVARACTRC